MMDQAASDDLHDSWVYTYTPATISIMRHSNIGYHTQQHGPSMPNQRPPTIYKTMFSEFNEVMHSATWTSRNPEGIWGHINCCSAEKEIDAKSQFSIVSRWPFHTENFFPHVLHGHAIIAILIKTCFCLHWIFGLFTLFACWFTIECNHCTLFLQRFNSPPCSMPVIILSGTLHYAGSCQGLYLVIPSLSSPFSFSSSWCWAWHCVQCGLNWFVLGISVKQNTKAWGRTWETQEGQL